LDLHREQITFDALQVESGEVWRGRLWQPDRARFRRWLAEELAPRAKGGTVAVVVEGCTGWRYVAEEVAAAGFEAHVAEPADTQAARGRKKRAKTDRSDSRLLRELLASGDLPESWIPPEAVLEWRERVRLYKTLLDQRRMWIQRIHAELFQHGVSLPEAQVDSRQTRDWLASDAAGLSAAARQRVAAGYHIIDATEALRQPLRAELERFARRQPACKALAGAHFGVGPLTAVVVWAELGDCRRFSRSDQVVRLAGLDVTVDASDRHRGAGHLSRQGPETLRWALFEAGMAASRSTSPDRAYYQAVKQAHDGKIAAIAMARKLVRR
jgi:transposase